VKLLHLHPPGQSASTSGVRELCAEVDFPFLEWSGELSDTWKDDLCTLLRESTHCCIVPPESDSEAWFLFAVAYCLGRGNPIFLLVSNPAADLPLPGYLTDSAVTRGNRSALRLFLTTERKSWKRGVIRRKVIEMLEKRGIPFTPEGFAQTVSDGDRRDIRLFLKTDMPVTIRNSRGVPLLNLAVRNGHRAVIPLLLSRGADIDAVSQDRENTALMDAAARGDQDILSERLEAGAKTDFQSKNGQTALVLAIGGGFIRCAELLIRAGADPTIKDKLGMDAVTYARLFKHESLLEMIAGAGGTRAKSNP